MTPVQPTTPKKTSGTRFSEWGAISAFIDVALIVLLVAVALLPVLSAYGTSAAIYAVITGVLAGAIPVLIGAYLRWPLPVTLAISVLVYVVIGGAVAFGDSLTAGLLPSRESIAGTLTGLVASWKQALTLDPPLGGDSGLLLLPFLMGYLGSLLAASLAVRRRTWTMTLLAVTVPLVIMATAILWGTATATYASLVGTIVAVSAVVWSSWRMGSWRPRRIAALATVLAGTIAAGVVAAPAVIIDTPRFVLRTVVEPPFDPQDQISPLSQYRSYVKDYAESDLVTARGLPEGAVIRLATMDSYDGVVWSVSGDGNRAGSGSFRRIGEQVTATVDGERITTTLEIGALRGVWLPTVGYLSSIDYRRGVANDVRYNDATGTAIDVAGVRQGLTYQLQAVLPPQPTDEDLGEARAGRIAIADADNIPSAVGEQASLVAREASTVPLVVRAFEEYFTTQGYFSHGEQVSGFPSLSGHGAARIADLLTAEQMVGDAEQYASAMALFARQQGFASRVVMGFIPEEEDYEAEEVTFTGEDMAAWVEVYFEDYGWVSYYPTPDESRTPNMADDQSEPEPQPDSVQPPPDPAPSVTPPSPDIEDPAVETQEDQDRWSIDWATVGRLVAVVGLPLILLLGPPILIMALKLKRRRRRARTQGRAKVAGAWNEILDTAVDHGVPPRQDLTRRETAKYIETQTQVRGMVGLAERADRAIFSDVEPFNDNVERFWSDALQQVAALSAGKSRVQRVRARLSLASLSRTRGAHTTEQARPASRITVMADTSASDDWVTHDKTPTPASRRRGRGIGIMTSGLFRRLRTRRSRPPRQE
ncbi:transglutaminaseTgpA domain-containing protein [Jonesia quinghaiensis]|uniref:transglutaminase family protein n=1 Tax=Jonesia quinghaiensis TaxID=262806 RepID=UPI000416766A|nr:transglutaminase domain-containing protein [Jonesia quinghaiensis]